MLKSNFWLRSPIFLYLTHRLQDNKYVLELCIRTPSKFQYFCLDHLSDSESKNIWRDYHSYKEWQISNLLIGLIYLIVMVVIVMMFVGK